MKEKPISTDDLYEHKGKFYYLDLDALKRRCSVPDPNFVAPENNPDAAPALLLDVAKWEVMSQLINTIILGFEASDDSEEGEGFDQEQTLGFVISFNTLYKDRILKTYE